MTYTQGILGLFDMHISQKPKDVLPIVDVQSKFLTILSNNKLKIKMKNASKVL